MLIEIVDSKNVDCPIIYYESEVIPSKGDSISMDKTKQYPGFIGTVVCVNHHISLGCLGQYPKAEFTVILEMIGTEDALRN